MLYYGVLSSKLNVDLVAEEGVARLRKVLGVNRLHANRQVMRFDYDPEVDALYIRLNEAKIIESEEVQPGIILDFDENGKAAGVEVLDASRRNTTPASLKK